MAYISKIDLSTAPQEVRAAVDNHLAQGYQLTNEKLTLLHRDRRGAHCAPASLKRQRFFRESSASILNRFLQNQTAARVPQATRAAVL